MLYRDIARIGILSSKLHVNAIQSPVHYYQIIKNFIVTAGSKVMPCFPVFEDNQGAVQLAENPITNSNTKHIDVRHHFLRELVRQRDIKVVQVPSKFQHADILTKALAFDLFAFHRKFLLNLK